MNVVFLRSNPVNPDPRIEKEVSSLIDAGHIVTIVCWDRESTLPKRSFLDLNGKPVEIYRGGQRSSYGGGIRNFWKLLSFQLFLLRWLLQHRSQFDVVHAADFDTVLPAWIVKNIFNKKLVYDIYDYYVDSFNVPSALRRVVEAVDLTIINTADAVIIASEARKEQIGRAKPRKVVILHNSPDATAPVPTYISNERPQFVYVGVLVNGRLIKELLDLFARRTDWDLQIAGFGPLEVEVSRYAASHRNIIFHGKVSYSDTLRMSSKADLLFATYDPTIPNHRYSSPNKLYEAMMLGKPIIVCDSTGIDAIVNENRIGASIMYDANAFEYAAGQLLSNKEGAAEMGRRGRALFEESYSWNIMGARLVQLYCELN